MLVGSQAGNAPNDIMGLFFLLCVLAFLVNGAATARAAPRIAGAAPPARKPKAKAGAAPKAADGGPGFDPDADEDHPQEGVVTEVPVTGDPRVLAGVGAGPLFLAALAAGLGIGTKITLLAALGALTLGIAFLAGRENWLKALGIWLGGILITSGFWYGRNLWHAVNPFPQIEKLGPINLPGPDQGGFYPREPHSLSEYYNDPGVWNDFFFPVLDDRLGPLWPLILLGAAVGLGVALLLGPQLADAGAGDHRGLRRLRLRLHSADRVRGPRPAHRLRRQPALRLAGADHRLRDHAAGARAAPPQPWPWILIGIFGLLILQGTFRIDFGGGFPIDPSPSWKFGHLDESLELAILLVGVPAGLVAAARAGVSRIVLAVGGGRRPGAGRRPGTHPGEAVPRPPLRGQRRPPARRAASAPRRSGSRSRCSGRTRPTSASAWSGRASAFGQYFFYGDDLSNHVQYLGQELRRGTFRQIANCKLLRSTINEGDYDYIVVTPRIRRETSIPPEVFWVGRGRRRQARRQHRRRLRKRG